MNNKIPALQVLGLLLVSIVFVAVLEQGKTSSVSVAEVPSISVESDGGPRAHMRIDPYLADFEVRNNKRQYKPYHDLKVFNREKSSPGMTLFGVNGTEEMVLLAHDGTMINSWPIDSDRSILMPESCSLVATHGTVMGSKVAPWKALRYTLREYNFGGDLLWEYGGKDILHHDVRYVPENDSFLTLRRRLVDYRGKRKFKDGFQMKADGILVVNRAGEEVFTWNAEDHLSHDFCGIRTCPTVEATELSRAELKRQKDWSHANTVSILPSNRWFDSGDERFRPGNYLIHVRNFWMSFIVDAQTKKVVWRFPEKEEFDADPNIQIRGGHESHMIPEGHPGAGNLLVFDNGNIEIRPYTRILEIDPIKRKLVWSYEDRGRFFSRTAGATQRLPNGNTLISEDLKGRVFEVTREGEIVWEVETPYRTARARRYPLDWCELPAAS